MTLNQIERSKISDKDLSIVDMLTARSEDSSDRDHLLYQAFLYAISDSNVDFAKKISDHITFQSIDLAHDVLLPHGLADFYTVNPITGDLLRLDQLNESSPDNRPVFTISHELDAIGFPGIHDHLLEDFLGIEDRIAEFEDPEDITENINDPEIKEVVNKLCEGQEDWYLLTSEGQEVKTQTFTIPDDELNDAQTTLGFHPDPSDYIKETNTVLETLLKALESVE